MVDDALVLDAVRAVIQARGEAVVPPVGFSMGERYRRADGLVLQRPRNPVRVGDVVAFARGSGWVLHRVVAIRGDRLVTQGDALGAPDEQTVTRAQVEAVLVARVAGRRRLPETRVYALWAVMRSRLRELVRG